MRLICISLLLCACSAITPSQTIYSTSINKDKISMVKDGDDWVFIHTEPACLGTSSRQTTTTKVTFASSQLEDKELSFTKIIPNLINFVLQIVGII